jgi:hypothetical protein
LIGSLIVSYAEFAPVAEGALIRSGVDKSKANGIANRSLGEPREAVSAGLDMRVPPVGGIFIAVSPAPLDAKLVAARRRQAYIAFY